MTVQIEATRCESCEAIPALIPLCPFNCSRGFVVPAAIVVPTVRSFVHGKFCVLCISGEHDTPHPDWAAAAESGTLVPIVVECEICASPAGPPEAQPYCDGCLTGLFATIELVPVYGGTIAEPVPRGVSAWVFIHDDEDRQGPHLHRIDSDGGVEVTPLDIDCTPGDTVAIIVTAEVDR